MIVNLRLSGARGSASDKRRRQQGFTLIELSIVLTIIGLIVGGILKGQELINNARLKTQVAQIDTVKSAVLTFQDRYGYLPGDFNNAASFGFSGSAATTNGDGNGAIGGGSGTAASITDTKTVAASESIMVWPELAASNLLAGFFVPTSTSLLAITNADTVSYLPGKVTGTYLWLGTYIDTVYPTGATLAVRLQGESAGAAPATALKEADMYGIDSKYDDGLPFQGSISVVDTTNVASGCVSSAATTGTYTTTAGNATALACVPLFSVQ